MSCKMVYINKQERILKWQQSTIVEFHSNFARINKAKIANKYLFLCNPIAEIEFRFEF